jgi:hypothetical protein
MELNHKHLQIRVFIFWENLMTPDNFQATRIFNWNYYRERYSTNTRKAALKRFNLSHGALKETFGFVMHI